MKTDIIEYKCENCGKLVRIQKRSFNKDLLLCQICKSKKRKFDRYGDENYNNKNKIKETCLKKYGVPHAIQAKEVKNKIEETCLKKYGFRHANSNKEIHEKSQQTKLKKYGYRGMGNYEKSRKTKLEKYGNETFVNPDKTKKTCLKKYGYDNNFKRPEIREKAQKAIQDNSEKINEKRKETMLKRYGGTNSWSSKEIRKKFEKTMLERYGGINPDYIPSLQKKMRMRYYYDGECFHSGYELKYYIYLKDHNISFEFRPDYLEYFIDGKPHRYYPDFKVNDRLVEIKGGNLIKNGVLIKYETGEFLWEKTQCLKDNNVLILTDTELKPIFDYINSQYGRDYIKQFKRTEC